MPVPAINDLPSFAAKRDYFNALNGDLRHYDNSNDICTPMECVKEMVDAVPAEFWQKKNLRILDSCCGNGNFHAYILHKAPLKNLFFNDINRRRIAHVRKCFGGGANITETDFLQFLPFEQYDLIVSNPPYAFFSGGKRAAKNHNLSRAFINKALELVRPGGYLLFIAPDNWMSLSDRNVLPEKMSRGQFVKINIHGAKKWFPRVGSSFTWFLWQNAPNQKPFAVENHYRIRAGATVKLPENIKCIPLFLSPEAVSMMRKTVMAQKPGFGVETSSDLHRTTKSELLSAEKDAAHPFRIIHTPKQTLWSARPHKYQNGWKVFVSLTDRYKTFTDENCGATQSIAFVRCTGKRQARELKSELDSDIYWFINEITRYGNFNNIRVLQKFPRLRDIALSGKEKKFVEKFAAEFRR